MTHVPLEKIGKRFHVWSLWDEAYLGIHGNDFHVPQVAPYEHKLLRLTALSEGPSLIGSNLHISMGATEVLSLERQQDKLQINLDPDAGATANSSSIRKSRFRRPFRRTRMFSYANSREQTTSMWSR